MIIKSLIDQDQYKFTMQNAVLELFPKAQAEYRFKNRGKHIFDLDFLIALKQEIQEMSTLKLTDNEYNWLKERCPYLKIWYLEYLKNYRFNPDEVETSLDDTNNLILNIKGPWQSTILWEVPLLAIISELYFKIIDTEWQGEGLYKNVVLHNQYLRARDKADKLCRNNCLFADFGTRRRRSFDIHKKVISAFYDRSKADNNTFIGSSNLYFSMKYNLRTIGSCAHEWTQGMQALESLNHCNYFALWNWVKVYNTSLGIALPDTITSDMFFLNFNRRFAMLYDGIRWDSGSWKVFTDKTVAHFKKLNIDPMSKFIIYSDSLNVDTAIKIRKYCENLIQCSFGIGTFFTSDFPNSPALNMVIKLWSINDFPVVKISDGQGKENGDPKAIENMKWIIKNQLRL